jgi:hypothetical protein
MTKSKLFSALMIAALLLAVSAPGIALAGAYESTWASTIAYQNIGSATATVYVAFYENAGDTSPDTYSVGTIAKDASEVIIVGSLVTGTFRGSAVLSADQPMAAVIMQTAGDTTTVRVRPLSNGFTAGTLETVIPTVFKLATAGTQFSIQNVGPGQATVNIKFQNADGSVQYSFSQVIEAGAGHFVDVKAISDVNLPASWQGSVAITRTAGTGMVVSSALELNTNSATYSYKGNAFEGIGAGALTLYMPTAQCKTGSGASLTNSSFAIYNPNGSTANITVTFTWNDSTTTVKTISLGTNGKTAVGGCDRDAGAEPTGKNGSGIIQSTNAVSFMAIGKLFNTFFNTAYNGIPVGYAKISLPFMRYASTAYFDTGNYQRTFISIQNISGFALLAGQVTVKYIDRDGTVLATYPMPAMIDGQKRGTNPTDAGLTEFGYYNSYTESGGGAIVECSVANCKLAVTARVQTKYSTGQQAEDYVGLPYP